MADFSLDHVLIAVRDLDQAAHAWTGDLGLSLSPEGVHPGRGTHNRLIVFPSEYLELIAFRDGSEGAFRPTMADLLDRREGLYMFALGSDDIGKAVSDLRSRGAMPRTPSTALARAAMGRPATPGSPQPSPPGRRLGARPSSSSTTTQ